MGLLGGVIEPEIAAYIALSLLLLGIVAASVFGKRLKQVLQPKADAAYEQVLARGAAQAQ